MGQPMSETVGMSGAGRPSPTVQRRRLGLELRRLRREAGLTIEEVARALECSTAKVSRIETGKLKARQVDVDAMLRRYGVLDLAVREQLLQVNREARMTGWWRSFEEVLPPGFETFVGLEAEAVAVRTYALAVVPGLLQTADYARALLRAGHRNATPEDVEQMVKLRTTRQERLLGGPNPLRLRAVVDEAVLHRPVGGRDVMEHQLLAMAEMASRTNVLLQVLPFETGAHSSLSGMFTLLELPDEADTDVVYVEGPGGSIYLEKPPDVRRAAEIFASLAEQALDPDRSVRVIHAAAEGM
jgi:transcriptional regulator with XRE-family HTH domain